MGEQTFFHQEKPGSIAAPDQRRRIQGIWISLTLTALVLRIVLLLFSPGITAFPTDHDLFVRWGVQAADDGVLTLYEKPPPRRFMQIWNEEQKRWQKELAEWGQTCNYPPLSAYLLYTSGLLHKAISKDRLSNTTRSRALFSFWSILSDFIVASGCAALVALVRPGRAVYWTYGLALLLPPLWWNSVIWAQMDSVLLAPTVWMLYFMVRDRWRWAGVLFGAAIMLKPQAVLFLPVWALAVFVGKPRTGPVLGLVVAGLVVFFLALPFTVSGHWSVYGPDWFRLSYWENIFSIYESVTTLKAFNIWYMDLLLRDSLVATEAWFGLSRNTWGKVLLVLGLLAGFVFFLRRWRNDSRALILWTTLSMLCFLMLPTQVHERYLIYLLPFLGVSAALAYRLLPAFFLMTFLMMVQITWPHWIEMERGNLANYEEEAATKYDRLPGAFAEKFPEMERFIEERRQASVERTRERYERESERTIAIEWGAVIIALVSTLLTVVGIVSLRPETIRRQHKMVPSQV